MRRPSWWVWLLAAGCGHPPAGPAQGDAKDKLTYPHTRQVDQVDTYHGVAVADPYRWLEDLDSGETRAWVAAQNEITFAYLNRIPERAWIKKRLTELWNFERYGVPSQKGERYFFDKNEGLQNQSVLYVAPALAAAPRVLIDPNQLSHDGTVSLAGTAISDDGRFMAYGLSTGGSDWNEWKVREVATGKDLADSLRWVKFSTPVWTRDHQGFFYSRYPEPKSGDALEEQNFFHQLYYHRLGTPQAADLLVQAAPEHKEWGFDAELSEAGDSVIISVWKGTGEENLVLHKQTAALAAKAVALVDTFEAEYDFLTNDGPLFYFKTTFEAPRGRIIAIDTRKPTRAAWREVVAESDATLEDAAVVGDRFILHYLRDAHSEVKVLRLDGTPERDIAMPELGTAAGFSGQRQHEEVFFSFASFARPTTIYGYKVKSGELRVIWAPKLTFTPNDYVTRQVFCTSKDGTRVPMFISHKAALPPHGRAPTLLYGYGGFNIPITPWFTAANLMWMEMGGVFAVANLRGGGEYGEEWHQAGTFERKQNVFDDFAAAAEWLQQNGVTSRDQLAILGRSNGGLLVGASITQRPELFAAALPAVGVMDMLRFHKFTIGWAWMDDYGSPEAPAQFHALRAYSPLHNLELGTRYPAVLMTTADHDDRVVPAHSFKFAAALQAAQGGAAPVLIRIETAAGHGRGTPTSKLIDEVADQWAFLVRTLGMAVGPGAQSVSAK